MDGNILITVGKTEAQRSYMKFTKSFYESMGNNTTSSVPGALYLTMQTHIFATSTSAYIFCHTSHVGIQFLRGLVIYIFQKAYLLEIPVQTWNHFVFVRSTCSGL